MRDMDVLRNKIGFTMIPSFRAFVGLGLILLASGAIAQHAHQAEKNAPYAGLQTREVKSLSDQDIKELREGRGWGLALPAELNGRPGPAHVLELREELDLNAEQITAVTEEFDNMRAAAILAGERLIAAETALDAAFVEGQLDKNALARLLSESEAARTELRMVHLSAHLATPNLLTQEQIERYNVLRGYSDDPCVAVPEGHNAAMWRRHNGCE